MTDDPTGHALTAPRTRRGYLDWIRGVAVLIMIEAHLIDSWTGAPDRHADLFGRAMIVGGFGAPLFLLLAGLAVSMSAGSKSRRSGDARAASSAVVRRGFAIFLLAFAFRVQAWILGWSSPWTLLRVDILNIMGPSIMLAAAIWGALPSARARVGAFAAATLALAFVTPIVRASSLFALLPDPVEAYFRPTANMTNFTFLPWAGFVFAGALLGVLVDQVRGAREARLNLAFGLGGLLLAAGAYAASFLPTPYARSEFWTSSPAFFFLRLGLLVASIAVAYAWERRPGGAGKWSPVGQLGRTSLFIYWIHVEMVYGLVSLPLHRALTMPQALLGLALFTVFMLLCSLWKDRVVAWWRGRRPGVGSSSPARVT